MDNITMAMVGCGGMAGGHVDGMKKLWDAGLRGFEVLATCDVVE